MLCKMSIDLILTAHPMEVNCCMLINKYDQIMKCLKDLDHSIDSTSRLDELISQIWHTNEICKQRPTPVNEPRWGFTAIENSLWEAIPKFLCEIDLQMKDSLGEGLPLEFTSWMGGNCDGNPNVIAGLLDGNGSLLLGY